MSNRKYDCRYVTSIPFEKAVFDEVNSLLPRGTDISDEINSFLKQRLVDLKNQKNEIADQIDRSAIKTTQSQYTIQTTLDKYVNPWILNWKDFENQNEIQAKLSYDEQLQLVTAFNKTAARFKAMMH